MFGETYLDSQSVFNDVFRGFLSSIDRPFYGLLCIVYQLFFNVASADIFSGGTISTFYSRIQLIIGVFVMFQLAMTILRGIVNPDTFTDSKSGFSNIVMRIATALIMLTLIVPINIPSTQNELEQQIKKNGILFGTLYSLQHRILENNTLGRLVLGVQDNDENYISGEDPNSSEALEKSARVFTSTVLRGFYRINLIPKENRQTDADKTDEQDSDNWVCRDMPNDIRDIYVKTDADPGEIISLVNETCNADGNLINNIPSVSDWVGTKKYMFVYSPVLSTITAIIFTIVLLSFTIDVAIRMIKLAILRLLAPIPIINYMDPKGGKDGAFSAWVKTLTTTYIDFFIRVALVYFIIFIIQEMIAKGVAINTTSGMVGVFSIILIWLALFIFAKQAPKFIYEALGIKGEPTFLSGFSEIASGLGAIGGAAAIVGGTIGAAHTGRVASRMADEANGKNAGSIFNRGKHLVAGMISGAQGAATGVSAWAGAKDHQGKAVMQALKQQNDRKYAQGDAGSTALGRAGTTLSRVFTGESSASRREREIGNWESRQKALDAVKSRVSGKMVKKDWTSGSLGIATDNAGNSIGAVNYKSFMAEYNAAQSRGDGVVRFVDANGVDHEISFADADRQKGYLQKMNEDSYIRLVTSGAQDDDELISLIQDAEAKGGSGWDGTSYSIGTHNNITTRDDYAKTSEGLGQDIRDAKRANAKAKADDLYSGK